MAASTWLIPSSSVLIENQDGAAWLVPGGLIGIEEAAPAVGAIMNQFQKTNIGADLYNGALMT